MNFLEADKELLGSMDVLFVEDDSKIVEAVIELFTSLFKSIEHCSNGQDALGMYTSKVYDIVITGINIPLMNGIEMSKQIKQINPDQSIVVLSSYAQDNHLMECINIGIDGFIKKPVIFEDALTILIKAGKNVEDKKDLLIYKRNNKLTDSKENESKKLANCAEFKALLRTEVKLNLILLNIDNFNNINYSYGIEYGDLVFKLLLERLEAFHFKNIEVYKLESDEFALVNRVSFDTEESIIISQEIVSFFNETPLELEEELEINLSLSIGIAQGKGLSILNNARVAIQDLRQYTRGTYKVYDMKSKFVMAIHDNVYWVNQIHESVADDSIVAFYQPMLNNKTKKIEKYECLARIYNDGKYISPYLFMQAAKTARVISFITKSIIKQACKTFAKTEYEFSINITNEDLQLQYLEDYLLRSTKKYNINPNRIVLELLEDISSLDENIIIDQLNSLKEKGFKLAIDDFGSESSNFSRLLEFTPDYIKIDGAFIKNIVTDKKSQIITEGIVSIAKKSGIETIAEYIHSQEVQDKIAELGIDYSQGYLHGEPAQKLKEV